MENPGSSLQDFHNRHHPLYVRDDIAVAVSDINAKINGCGFYFCWDKGSDGGHTSYSSLPEDVLVILSSFDFSYYYNLELAFHGLVYHDLEDEYPWPDHWSKDQLVLFSEADAQKLMDTQGLEHDPKVYLFGLNIGSHSDNTFYILAKGFSYYFGTVFYYNRLAQDTLQEGQRVAYWVSTSS